MSKTYEYAGFEELSEILKQYSNNIDKVTDVLEVGAKEFTKDLLKLPKPISKIKKSSYTHLIDTFAYKRKKDEVEVGWGKYYGPMLEHGTVKMNAYAHVNPLWNKNKEKYYKKMVTKLGL